jgi:hypothetical protein
MRYYEAIADFNDSKMVNALHLLNIDPARYRISFTF